MSSDGIGASSPGRGPTATDKLTFVRLGDLHSHAPDYLVCDLIECDSLVMLFGDPESGKSLLALDIAARVASGTDFHGRPVKQGPVLLVIGEGMRGIVRRRDAWSKDRGIDLAEAPLFVSTTPTELTNKWSQRWLMEELRRFMEEHGKPVLIIIDTLARNFGRGDENSASDMNGVVAACDELRRETNATVLSLHHCGHGDKGRARGSGALRAAMDTELLLTRGFDGALRLTSTKTKDAAPITPMSFRIAAVELDLSDIYGRPVTAPVLIHVQHMPAETPRTAASGKNQAIALEALRRLTSELDAAPTISQWKEAATLPVNRFGEVRESLVNSGRVRIEDGRALLSERIESSEFGSVSEVTSPGSESSEFGGTSDPRSGSETTESSYRGPDVRTPECVIGAEADTT